VHVTVIADVNEQPSGIPVALAALGATVELDPLPAGDYAVSASTLVERKSVLDLHGAVLHGRFWRQLGKLRAASRFAYLIIEGTDLDSGPLTPTAVRGVCLAALEQRIRLLRTNDRDDTALWLYRLAVRSQRSCRQADRPVYAQRPSPPSREVPEAMLAAVPGISTARARALLEQFGTVPNVLAAGREGWLQVAGIGQKIADEFEATLRGGASLRSNEAGKTD
jgi:ERCC4-type nuclease